MRLGVANDGLESYLNTEVLLNNLKLVSINSGTERALAIGIVNAAGDLVATLPVSLASLPALPTGSNAIGKLAANSGVDIGDVDVTSLPALVAGTGRIGGVYDVSGQLIDEGGVVRTINRSFVDASNIGNTEVVAAQGGTTRIRVLSFYFVATTALTVKFQSATTNISPGLPVGATGGLVAPYNPHGWFQTAANEALNINLGLGIATGCMVNWCQAV